MGSSPHGGFEQGIVGSYFERPLNPVELEPDGDLLHIKLSPQAGAAPPAMRATAAHSPRSSMTLAMCIRYSLLARMSVMGRISSGRRSCAPRTRASVSRLP